MIYFDNAATTPCRQEVFEAMQFASFKCFFNPAALYPHAIQAENLVKSSKENIAKIINAKADEIFITSGGTESINTAIYGVCDYKKPKPFVSSIMEHSAAHNCLLEVEKMGNTVSFIGSDKRGHILMEDIEKTVTKDTVLFNLIYVNNEIGVIQDAKAVTRLVKKCNPKCYVHLDATQALGKMRIDVEDLGIDLLSASAHKFNGPKGVGLLYKKKGCNIKPLIVGGGQQGNFRSGTENVAGTLALSVALTLAYDDFEKKETILKNLKSHFVEEVLKIDGVIINSPIADDYSDSIVSVSIRDIRSEVLLNELSKYEICISAGSACHSYEKNISSRTLNSIGVPKELQKSTVRFSFSYDNTIDEIDFTVEKLKDAVEELKKYVRR